MPENVSIENWWITIDELGAGEYQVSGDRPVAPGAAHLRASERSTLQRDAAYQALRERTVRGETDGARLLGERLFAFLFKGEMGNAFGEWCARVLPKSQPSVVNEPRDTAQERRVLRIILALPSTLSDEPWEYLYTHYLRLNTFLGLNDSFSIVRYVEPIKLNEERKPIPTTEISVLALNGDPPPSSVNERLDTAGELAALRRLLGDSRVHELAGNQVSLSEIDRHLEANPKAYHILHFMGHSGDGQILLQTDGHESAVSADDFAIMLQHYRALRVLVFMSCASSRNIDPLIHLLGAPAIIAMQATINDEASLIFTETLYGDQRGGLQEGTPLDLAVNAARLKLHHAYASSRTQKTIWGCPTVSVSSIGALHCFIVAPGPSASGVIRRQPATTVVLPDFGSSDSRDTRPLPALTLETKRIVDLVTEGIELKRAHQTEVSALTFIGDEYVLMSGSSDSALKAWQVEATAPTFGDPASQIQGAWTGFGGTVVLLHPIAESPGSYVVLSASTDLNLMLWRWKEGSWIARTRFAPTIVQAAATDPVTPSALVLVTDGGKFVYTRDIKRFFENTATERGLDIGGRGRAAAFSSDGVWMAIASQRAAVTLKRRDADGGFLETTLPSPLMHDPNESVQSVIGIAPSRFVTGSSSSHLYLWDVGGSPRTPPHVLQQFKWNGEVITRLQWLANQKLLLTASSGAIALWRVDDKILETPVWERQPAGGTVACVAAYSKRDGAIVAVGLSSGSIVLYYLRSNVMDDS